MDLKKANTILSLIDTIKMLQRKHERALTLEASFDGLDHESIVDDLRSLNAIHLLTPHLEGVVKQAVQLAEKDLTEALERLESL